MRDLLYVTLQSPHTFKVPSAFDALQVYMKMMTMSNSIKLTNQGVDADEKWSE